MIFVRHLMWFSEGQKLWRKVFFHLTNTITFSIQSTLISFILWFGCTPKTCFSQSFHQHQEEQRELWWLTACRASLYYTTTKVFVHFLSERIFSTLREVELDQDKKRGVRQGMKRHSNRFHTDTPRQGILGCPHLLAYLHQKKKYSNLKSSCTLNGMPKNILMTSLFLASVQVFKRDLNFCK